MKYYLQIFKIVSGVLSGDRKLVLSRTELLCEKLKLDEEAVAVKGGKDNRFSLADKTYPLLEKQILYLTESK
jgi:hypothetical protein